MASDASPNRLQVVEGIGRFRLVGPWGFQQAVQAVKAAVVIAREDDVRRMLVITIEATGFEPPSTADRHRMVRGWTHASMGRVAIAMVVPPAFIDSERFGVVAAANFGMLATYSIAKPMRYRCWRVRNRIARAGTDIVVSRLPLEMPCPLR